MLVTGLAMATSVRVSNSLGAGFPRTARRATLCALLLTMALEIAAGGPQAPEPALLIHTPCAAHTRVPCVTR